MSTFSRVIPRLLHLNPKEPVAHMELQRSMEDEIRVRQALLDHLKETYQTHLHDREVLDKKAWDILSFTSGLIGLITAIQIGLLGDSARVWYWLSLFIVLTLYALLVLEIRRVVKPRVWLYPPGISEREMTFTAMIEKYEMNVHYRDYLLKLISNYTINDLAEDYEQKKQEGKDVRGAIQIAEDNNREKAKYLHRGFRLMSLVIFALILSSVTALIP